MPVETRITLVWSMVLVSFEKATGCRVMELASQTWTGSVVSRDPPSGISLLADELTSTKDCFTGKDFKKGM